MKGLLRREWLRFSRAMGKAGLARFLAIYIGVFGLFIPSQIGNPDAAVIIFGLLPVYIAGPVSVDAFAGERDRKTLETFLTSPVTPLLLLASKALFCVLFSLAAAWLSLGLFTIFRLIRGIQQASPEAYLFALVLGVLVSWLSSSIGMNVSIRAQSARSAQQWYSIVLVAVTLGIPLGIRFIAERVPGRWAAYIGELFRGGWVSTGTILTFCLVLGVSLALSLRLYSRVPRLWLMNDVR